MASFRIDPVDFVRGAAYRATPVSEGMQALETGQGLAGIGLTAAYPVADANPNLRGSYSRAWNMYSQASPIIGGLRAREAGAALLNPYDTGGGQSIGQAYFAETVKPGNLFGTAADALLYSTPLTGGLAFLNERTKSETDPHGQIPFMEDLDKAVAWVGSKLNESKFGQAVAKRASDFYGQTIGRITRTEAFKTAYDATGSAYTALDKYLMGGVLPGGAKISETPHYSFYENLDRRLGGRLPGGITPRDHAYEKFRAGLQAEDQALRQEGDAAMSALFDSGEIDLGEYLEMEQAWQNADENPAAYFPSESLAKLVHAGVIDEREAFEHGVDVEGLSVASMRWDLGYEDPTEYIPDLGWRGNAVGLAVSWQPDSSGEGGLRQVGFGGMGVMVPNLATGESVFMADLPEFRDYFNNYLMEGPKDAYGFNIRLLNAYGTTNPFSLPTHIRQGQIQTILGSEASAADLLASDDRMKLAALTPLFAAFAKEVQERAGEQVEDLDERLGETLASLDSQQIGVRESVERVTDNAVRERFGDVAREPVEPAAPRSFMLIDGMAEIPWGFEHDHYVDVGGSPDMRVVGSRF